MSAQHPSGRSSAALKTCKDVAKGIDAGAHMGKLSQMRQNFFPNIVLVEGSSRTVEDLPGDLQKPVDVHLGAVY